jgi:hypothetical protein
LLSAEKDLQKITSQMNLAELAQWLVPSLALSLP